MFLLTELWEKRPLGATHPCSRRWRQDLSCGMLLFTKVAGERTKETVTFYGGSDLQTPWAKTLTLPGAPRLLPFPSFQILQSPDSPDTGTRGGSLSQHTPYQPWDEHRASAGAGSRWAAWPWEQPAGPSGRSEPNWPKWSLDRVTAIHGDFWQAKWHWKNPMSMIHYSVHIALSCSDEKTGEMINTDKLFTV